MRTTRSSVNEAPIELANSQCKLSGEPSCPVRVGFLFDGGGMNGGGVLAIAGNLLRALDRRHVTVVGMFLGEGPERDHLGPLCDEVYDLGTGTLLPSDSEQQNLSRLLLRIRAMGVAAKAAVRAFRVIRQRRIEMVHVHFFPLHLVAGAACRASRIPCIWHWHGGYGGQGLLARLGFAHLCGVVVCISRFVMSRLPRAAQVKAQVIYNGVATEELSCPTGRGELRRLLGLDALTPLVGMCGTLNPLKGQEDFVRAAGIVNKQLPHTRFCLIGSETPAMRRRFNLTERLPALAQSLGLADRLSFLGHRDDAAFLMGDCDVACVLTVPFLDAEGEGFGLVTAEAMAAGSCVVGTSCGATPELVEDGVSGVLVNPGDPEAVSRTIVSLLTNPHRRKAIAAAAQRRIGKHFDIRLTARRMEQLYGVVKSNHARAVKRNASAAEHVRRS